VPAFVQRACQRVQLDDKKLADKIYTDLLCLLPADTDLGILSKVSDDVFWRGRCLSHFRQNVQAEDAKMRYFAMHLQ
jgi:hypothetical protein